MRRQTKDAFIVNLILLIIICGSIAAGIYWYGSKALSANLEQSLVVIATQGAQIVEKDIGGKLGILDNIAQIQEIKDESVPVKDKIEILTAEFKKDEFLRMSIAALDGNSVTTDGSKLYVGDREYFKKAVLGIRNVSDPIISRVDGTLVNVFAVPIINNGKITGVLYATYSSDEISKITDNIKLGENGSSFIISQNGAFIAHEDRSKINSIENISKSIVTDQESTGRNLLIKKMTSGQEGVGIYTYMGVKKLMGYAPIKSLGWSIAVTAPENQIFNNIFSIITFFTVIALIILLAAGFMSFYARRLQTRLKRAQVASKSAIDTADIIIIGFNHEGTILEFNSYAEGKTQYERDEVIGVKTIFELAAEKNPDRPEALMSTLNEGGLIKSFELPIKGKDEKTIYALWNTSINELNKSDYLEIMGIDITARVEAEKKLIEGNKELTHLYEQISESNEELASNYDELAVKQDQLRKSEERYKFVIEVSDIGIWDWDIIEKQSFFSYGWYSQFGLTKKDSGDLMDKWFKRVHPEDLKMAYKSMRDHMKKKTESYECEYRVLTAEGEYRWIHTIGKAKWDDSGKAVRMAGTHTDITEKKEFQTNIHNLAYFDTLTKLPNRIQLIDKINEGINTKYTSGALFFIDIDNFKIINDSYGHSIGDVVLVEMGKRISTILDKNIFVARIGGDEFTVWSSEVKNIEDIGCLVEKLMGLMNTSISVIGITINISSSIGIAVFPKDGASFEELMKNADIAMYKAKELGKRTYRFFDKSMNDALIEKTAIEYCLRKALENEEFLLYYQPQVDLVTGKVSGLEALIRWESPEFGFVYPDRFIDIAEETGLIIDIGKWVLKTACEFLKRIHKEGFEKLNVSVNVSVIQLVQENFSGTVLAALEETGLDSDHLDLEITETILMESIEANINKITNLRKNGLKISLDDFGKGYSSLTYLRQIPITTLKIDKAFIDDINTVKQDYDIIQAITVLAHNLDLRVIAEGVESPEQLDMLKKCSCDTIQGYLISKPLPEAEIVELLKRSGGTLLAGKSDNTFEI